MNPTHALYVVDNWDGEGEKYWTFAYKKNDDFYSVNSDKRILQHQGDKILNEVSLMKDFENAPEFLSANEIFLSLEDLEMEAGLASQQLQCTDYGNRIFIESIAAIIKKYI